jgi:hypothetical protein
MARDFNLDPKAAKESNVGNKRLSESGAFPGVIKAAWYDKNEKGTESVHIQFTADDGREANQLVLYTHNGDGKALSSFNTFNAILACARIKHVTAQRQTVELYDFDAGGMVKRDKECYVALHGKPIGLFLQLEERKNRAGEIKASLSIAGAFEAKTKLVAAEILNSQTDAAQFPKIVDWLTKNPVRKLRGGSGGQAQQGSSAPTGGVGFDDDDIPF